MTMDLEYVLAQLRRERDAIAAAIDNLERLGRFGGPIPSHPAPKPANGFHRTLTEEDTRHST
jgi:hypothetical protein